MSLELYADGSLLFAPSMLVEGKALGTARHGDITLLRNLFTTRDYHPTVFARERKIGQTVGRRKLHEVQQRVSKALNQLVSSYQAKRLSEAELRDSMARVMKEAWRDVFIAGARGGGMPAGQHALVDLDVADDNWLRSAMKHEMQFLNGMLDAIVEETFVMPLPRRIQMYVDALASFYESARVSAMPENIVIHWLGRNDDRTCPSCKYLIAHSPYTKSNLPTAPRSGIQCCLCLTDCRAMILTHKGSIPWREVSIGDRVYTHRGRWRKVTGKQINRSVAAHRYAVLVGVGGELFGVTADHRVWTAEGWVTAQDAAVRGLRVLRKESVGGVPERIMPFVRAAASVEFPEVGGAAEDAGNLQAMQCADFREEGGVRALRVLRDNRSLEGGGGSDETNSDSGDREEAPYSPRGFDRGVISLAQTRRAYLCAVLARERDAVCVPLSLAMGEGQRDNPAGVYCASPERGLRRRPAGKSGIVDTPRTRFAEGGGNAGGAGVCVLSAMRAKVSSRQRESARGRSREVLFTGLRRYGARKSGGGEVRALRKSVYGTDERGVEGGGSRLQDSFLLHDLLQRCAKRRYEDSAVRLLRQEFSQAGVRDTQVSAGQVLLLSSVLSEGARLYDLDVEEDHSFVANGLVVHNSNCRCRILLCRVTPQEAAKIDEAAHYTRGGHIKNLRRIKRTRKL